MQGLDEIHNMIFNISIALYNYVGWLCNISNSFGHRKFQVGKFWRKMDQTCSSAGMGQHNYVYTA